MTYSFEEKLKSGLGTTNRSNKVNVGAHVQGVEIIDINQPRSALPVLGRNQRYEIVEADVKRAKIKFGIDVSTTAFDKNNSTLSITFGQNTTPQVITVKGGDGPDSTSFSDPAIAKLGIIEVNKNNLHNETLIIQDALGRSVTFTYNKFASTHDGSGTSYRIPAREITDATTHSEAIRGAINLARSNGDLGVFEITNRPGLHVAAIFLVQQDSGVSGNTTITGSVVFEPEEGLPKVNLSGTGFTGGEPGTALLHRGNGSFKNPAHNELDFSSRMLPILNSDPNFKAYFLGFKDDIAEFRIEAIHADNGKFDLSVSSNNANVQSELNGAEIQKGSRKILDVSKNDYFTDLDGVYDSSHHDNPTLTGYFSHVGLEGNFASASRPFAFATMSDAGVTTTQTTVPSNKATATLKTIEDDKSKLLALTLTLKDAAGKIVSFTYDNINGTSRLYETGLITHYKIGLADMDPDTSSAARQLNHATAVRAAVNVANANGDIGITADYGSPMRHTLILTQDTEGEEGNTTISGTAIDRLAITLDNNFSFTGGSTTPTTWVSYVDSAGDIDGDGEIDPPTQNFFGSHGSTPLGGLKTARLISMPNDRVRQKISFNLEVVDYGFGKEYKETTPFFDLGAYDAVSYVNESGPTGMFPIVGSFASYDSALQLNGIIEPFEIRRKIIGNSILLPSEGPINAELATKNPNAIAGDHWFDSRTLNKRTEFYEDVSTRGFLPSTPYIDPLQDSVNLRLNDKVFVISKNSDGVINDITTETADGVTTSFFHVTVLGSNIKVTRDDLSLPRNAGPSDPQAHAAACLEGEFVSDFTQNIFPWEDREQKDFILNVDSGILSVLQSMNPMKYDDVLPLYASDMATGFDSFARDKQNSITYRGLLRS